MPFVCCPDRCSGTFCVFVVCQSLFLTDTVTSIHVRQRQLCYRLAPFTASQASNSERRASIRDKYSTLAHSCVKRVQNAKFVPDWSISYTQISDHCSSSIAWQEYTRRQILSKTGAIQIDTWTKSVLYHGTRPTHHDEWKTHLLQITLKVHQFSLTLQAGEQMSMIVYMMADWTTS